MRTTATIWNSATVAYPALVTESPAMRQVVEAASRSAMRDAKVLITGESGVGKDVVARFIHASSSRANRPFIAVNCAALSETLLESELFGHVKGSFTGAFRDKAGKLQLADQGTIFMDEVGEMTPRMQALLLRFLESGEVQPVGSDSVNRRVDTRVIAATNRDLQAMAACGQFRLDLMYRIKVIHLHVPSLRERQRDIRPLAEHFLGRIAPQLKLSAEAWGLLEAYEWPGNVRELQNVAEQLASLHATGELQADDLPRYLQRGTTTRMTAAVERRRTVVDDLFTGLIAGTTAFWRDVYTLFIDRDITRRDLRDLVTRGLAASHGNYRELVRLFGMPEHEYKRLLNFLVRHECAVDYRPYRRKATAVGATAPETSSAIGRMCNPVSPGGLNPYERIAAGPRRPVAV